MLDVSEVCLDSPFIDAEYYAIVLISFFGGGGRGGLPVNLLEFIVNTR